MELVTHVFPVLKRQGDPVLIMPVGDIQWSGDDKEVALKMLAKHIQWGVDQGAYFIGMGDYIDCFSPSNRERLTGAALYDTAKKAVDKLGRELVKEVYEKALAPSKGRWLGLLEGHHFHEYRDGTTTDQELAGLLGCPFLGSSAYVRMKFVNNRQRGDVVIYAHHGVGTGSTAASVLNRLGNVSKTFKADIYLMGHLHRKVAEPVDYIEPIFPDRGGEPDLVHRTRIMACTGSFLKGYMVGRKDGGVPRGNYAEQKMLNPHALGGVIVKVRPRWKDTAAGTVFMADLNVEQ